MTCWKTIKRRCLTAGAVLLFGPALPDLSLAAPPPPAAAQAPKKPAPPHPHKTLQERLSETEKALAFAGNEQIANHLADQAETLRAHALTGAVRLLLTDSQDALDKHDFQTAEDDLTSALTLQPDQEILRRHRATVRLMAGDNDGAIADLAAALQTDPGDTTAWGLLANAEHDRHEPDAALRAYHHMMELNPHTPDADKKLKTLQKEKDGQED